MKVVTAICLALLTGAALATNAFAGGWATTLVDPLPERLQSGQAYTIGYWVLQHGSHPSQIPLGQTGLRLVDEGGVSTVYPGVALPEPAHFAAAVAIPHDGSWVLYGEQGPFAEYRIGTAQVPGGLAVLPVPMPMGWNSTGEAPWTAIHPPQFVTQTTATGTLAAGLHSQPLHTAAQVGKVDASRAWQPRLMAIGLLAGLGLMLGLLMVLRKRSLNQTV